MAVGVPLLVDVVVDVTAGVSDAVGVKDGDAPADSDGDGDPVPLGVTVTVADVLGVPEPVAVRLTDAVDDCVDDRVGKGVGATIPGE